MKPISLLLISFFIFTHSLSAQNDCVPVNYSDFCVDIVSVEYFIVVDQDEFCCDIYWDAWCQEQYASINGPSPDFCNDQPGGIYGCTDPNAANYNPNATIDDGSCLNSQIDNDICEDASPLQEGTHLISNIGAVTNVGIWGQCWGFGAGEGEQSSIWFSFTTPDEPASIFIEATPDGSNSFTDTQFGLFQECGGEMIHCDGNGGPGLFSAFDFACGELEENTTYILMIDGYFGDVGTCFLTYEVTTECPEVEGCTDPAAYNYNPLATLDNGSCAYVDSCASNLVELHINTANWGNEISWSLLLEGNVVANGDGYVDFSDYTTLLCLEDGCYTFEMFDSFGDGWNGGTYEFVSYGQNVSLASGTLSSGSYGTASLGINTECTEECGDLTFDFIPFGNPALGCVISTEATYSGEDQSGTLVWDFGAGTPPQTGFDWSSGYQYSANGTYQVCVTYTTENCTVTYCDVFVATDCGPQEIYGCTDPNAINYNPNATVNDGSCQYADSCLTNLALLQINTEMWGAEISWSIFNDGNEVASGDGYANYETYNHWICLDDGCYTIEMYDSWGDGWNGGTFELSVGNETILGGTLESGEWGYYDFGINTEDCVSEVYGCTDPEATNYNPFATNDDGSCEYEECPNTLYLTITGGENLTDSAYVYWVFSDINQSPAAIGPHFAGDAPHEICAPDACYILAFGPIPDGWEGNYTLTMDGVVLASGAIEGNTSFMSVDVFSELLGCEPDEAVFGCTDPNAINFDPNATEDDGSCEYEECPNTLFLTITGGENLPDSAYVYWVFFENNQSPAAIGPHFAGDAPHEICAPDACYILAFGPIPDGWEGNYSLTMDGVVLASGAIEGNTSFMSVDVFSELLGCEPDEDVFGCTDPNAINYNPNATEDDGSCEYEFECGISFTVSPDSTGAQVIWITPSDNIFNAVEVLWDFGDGNTSTDLFPSHTYAGDGPYLLCLTALFADPNSNDYCSITFCAELTNEMINPPGMQSNGFSINVVNPGSVTGVEDAQQITDLNLWPNPTDQFAQLEWTMLTGENVTIVLFDLSGKQAQAHSMAASPGKNLYTIDAANLPSGMYVVRIIGQEHQSTTKLIKH